MPGLLVGMPGTLNPLPGRVFRELLDKTRRNMAFEHMAFTGNSRVAVLDSEDQLVAISS